MIGLGLKLGASLKSPTNVGASWLAASVSRASTRTVLGYAAGAKLSDGQTLLTVPQNIPALPGYRLVGSIWYTVDVDGVPLPIEGLSTESAATNKLEYSEDFTQPEWSKTELTVVADAESAPDGTLTADKLVPTGALSNHFVLNNSNVTVGQDYTFSVYVKAGGYGFVQITGSTGFASDWFNINLADGTIGNSLPGASSIKVDSPVNGFYRVQYTTVATSTTGTGRCILAVIPTDVGARLPSFSGDTVSGIYTWGASLEAGSVSSYIPTLAASVTKQADVVTVPFPNLLGVKKGAIELVFTPEASSQFFKILLSMDVDGSNFWNIQTTNTGILNFITNVAGVFSTAAFTHLLASGTKTRLQVYWDDVLGTGIRSADESADISTVAFNINAIVRDQPLLSSITVGSKLNASFFKATNHSLIFHASKESAGW